MTREVPVRFASHPTNIPFSQFKEQLYKDISAAHQGDRANCPAFYDLFDLVPRFFGTRSLVIGKRQKAYNFLELEDIICSYSQPCVMDIKIGRVSFDPKASNEKKISELKKSPFQQVTYTYCITNFCCLYRNAASGSWATVFQPTTTTTRKLRIEIGAVPEIARQWTTVSLEIN